MSMRSWWRGLLREVGGVALAVAIGVGLLVPLRLAVKAAQGRLAAERAAATAARRQEAASVVVTVVTPVLLEDFIRLPGLIEALQDVTVAAEVAGRVVERPVAEGSTVAPGALLCRIEEEDYRIARDRAAAALALAATERERVEALVRQQVAPAAERDRAQNVYDQARADLDGAALALARCRITSPLGGVVDRIWPEVGERLAVGDPVATVLDLSRVKVEVGIPEREVAAVRQVESCTLRVDALGGRRFTGCRSFLGAKPLEQAMVYRLQLILENADGQLRPGMFVEAELLRARRPEAIVVPLFAILAGDEGYSAYVVEEEAGAEGARLVARRRAVKTGIIRGRDIEIVEGLRAGDRLVVLGHRAVDDGSPVAVARTVQTLSELLQ